MEPAGTTWLVATVPAALVGAVLLVFAIRGVVRGLRIPPLARLRVVAEQPFTLAAAGPVMLSVEGPHFTTKFGSLDFAVRDAAGRDVPVGTVLFRRHSTTLGGVTQLSLRRFTIERPGSYVLRIAGIEPSTDYTDCAIVLTPPTSPLLPLWIVGIVAGAMLLLGGIVLSILLLAGKL